MAIRPMFQKPKDVRWVDMAIYIDNNIYGENPDYDTLYKYFYLLAYMLACKKKYFDNQREYEEFASFLAYSSFQRMTDTSKSKVKSVLNYMNSIIYFRKAAYESQRHQEVIDPSYNENWDSYAYADKIRIILENNNRRVIERNINELIKTIPTEIKNSIPAVYKINKLTYSNLYKSCLLSLLNRFTLPVKAEDKLQSKLSIPSFDEVKYYRNHSNDGIILWHLEDEMKSVVEIILNKVDIFIIDEIKHVVNESRVSDDELNWVMASSFAVGGSNVETNY